MWTVLRHCYWGFVRLASNEACASVLIRQRVATVTALVDSIGDLAPHWQVLTHHWAATLAACSSCCSTACRSYTLGAGDLDTVIWCFCTYGTNQPCSHRHNHRGLSEQTGNPCLHHCSLMRAALLLLFPRQHPPVYTLGAGSNEGHVKFNLDNPPHPLYRTERGGEVTYHGPGQV